MNLKHQLKWENLPFFLLLLLSFYPLMKPALASIGAILFLSTTIIIFRAEARLKFERIGIKSFATNCLFYVLLIISVFYSENLHVGFKALQSSVLIFFFPIAVFYFLPNITNRFIDYFSYGFILSNLIILFYFYNLFVEALTIDRFAHLTEKSFWEQLEKLNLYPYEFVLSKAEKHLTIQYESHKVYLALHFFVTILLAVRLLLKVNRVLIFRIILSLLILVFIAATIYTQSITTVFCLILFIIGFPLAFLRSKIKKIVYCTILLVTGALVLSSGILKTYENKNTTSIIKLFTSINGDLEEEVVDKRIYIYRCAVNLIKKNSFLGYGVGDVQQNLNNCYNENNYKVAEYKSIGSDINSHNYYLNLWLSAGLFCILTFLYLLYHNIKVSILQRNFIYTSFLLFFAISLMTENILVRMSGVFLFTIFNSLFYSSSNLNVKKKV
ncbi:O-antigen ligase family protein [Maribacter litopenaei]|uniref:O-antigen ligase family protein n=1 Tax=Maribacter litopenaei TaxID=2976127 RepID=A0ABY5Y7J4_9FLAO|nr:O-antigen ligase family protein [Maribacter litopenaei]UWX55002.1 O-antigen ligase family protein [Maribacter litopenaei]